MRIKNLTQTCGACPSQWEGEREDGAHVFIHYRHGHLYVSVNSILVFSKNISDNPFNDGVMDTEEMLRITGLEMVYDQA